MSSSESTRVLEALNVLCKASGELFRPHTTELRAAAQKLQLLIENPSTTIVPATSHIRLPPTTGDSGQLPPFPDSDRSFLTPLEDPLGPSPAQHNSPQLSPQEHGLSPAPLSSTEEFIANLNTRLNKIEGYIFELGHNAVKHEPEWKTGDPRLVDLQIGGDRTQTPITKLRRGLSQRSLAVEFDDWESQTYQTSRLGVRTNTPSEEPSRKLGHITEFLETNQDRFHNNQSVSKGIEHGIKLLVCENLLGGMGFSAIFIFRYTDLRKIKYEELNSLRDLITSSDPIKKLAERKANWFSACQRDYNTWYTGVANPRQPPLRKGSKRRRFNNSLKKYNRLEPRKPHGSNQHTNTVALTTGAEEEALDTQVTSVSDSNITVTLPLQQTRSLRHVQSQQSPASRHPPLQHLIHTDSPQHLRQNVSTDVYDGAPTNSTSMVAMDSVAQPSFSNLGSALFPQSNTLQGANGSISIRHPQYDGQNTATPSQHEEGRNMESSNGFAAEPSDRGIIVGSTAGISTYDAPCLPNPDCASMTGTCNDYASYYLGPDDMFTSNYAQYFLGPDDMFTSD